MTTYFRGVTITKQHRPFKIMSLETLLEAARFVEQQELHAKQLQTITTFTSHPHTTNIINNNHVARATSFKIISPVPIASNHALPTPTQPQLSHSPPAALVAVPQVSTVLQAAPPAHPLVAAGPIANGNLAQSPRIPGQLTQLQNTSLVLAAAQVPGVVEVIQKPSLTSQPAIQTITNGFDKATALLLEEGPHSIQDSKKRGHIPSVMRSGTREVHNKLEKNRRAHLKKCFEVLKKQLPLQQDEKKTSNLSILHSALRHIQVLKKKERENEHEMERLAREKIAAQQRLAGLKKELGAQWDNIDFSALIPDQTPITVVTNHNTNLTSISTSATAVPTISTTSGLVTSIKDEKMSNSDGIHTKMATSLQPTQLSVLPIQQMGYQVNQGLVLGVQKVALLSKSLPLVSSPVTHIIAAPQINGKMVPLVNAQYVMKPVVVVSTPNTVATTISPRPS